jgi:hypothetical protein
MEHTATCDYTPVFTQAKLYKLSASFDGRYQVESFDRNHEQWFVIYADDDRARAVIRLNWLLSSAQGQPYIVCPHCEQPLPLPDLCYVGEDGLYYCSRGCEIDRRIGVFPDPMMQGLTTGLLLASLLWAFGFFCWWHITLQGGVR